MYIFKHLCHYKEDKSIIWYVLCHYKSVATEILAQQL